MRGGGWLLSFEQDYHHRTSDKHYHVDVLAALPEADNEQETYDLIVRQMAEAQGIDEELKARDQMAWVGAMNNIRSAAREFYR